MFWLYTYFETTKRYIMFRKFFDYFTNDRC